MDEVKFSIVIPVYNEEDNVIPLYNELKDVLMEAREPYEVIFVDDGSTDRTFERLLKLHEVDGRVKIIRFRRNFGQSLALAAGFKHATGEIVISMDGDLQNDPRDIPRLVEKLNEGYDVICGWRWDRKDPLFKKWFSRIANWLRRKITGERIHDSGCTLRAYRRACLEGLELFGELHRYIPTLLFWKGYKIGELKVSHRRRVFGRTKYGWKRLAKGFLDLLVVSFWQKYSYRPMHIFGGVGLLSTLIGFILGTYLVILRLFFGVSLAERPLFLISILLILMGIQFMTIGILSDIMVRLYYRAEGSYQIEKVVS
jgi:glycosyltransferase involved in cell wall biosynthesis